MLLTSARWAWKHVAGFLRVGILVLLFLQPVFSMADACSVANNSPLFHDRVVETRFGQGSPRWELQSHLSAQEDTKWCKAFVPKQEYSCGVPSSPLPAYQGVCWHLECLFAGGKSLEIVGCVVPMVLLGMIQPWRRN